MDSNNGTSKKILSLIGCIISSIAFVFFAARGNYDYGIFDIRLISRLILGILLGLITFSCRKIIRSSSKCSKIVYLGLSIACAYFLIKPFFNTHLYSVFVQNTAEAFKLETTFFNWMYCVMVAVVAIPSIFAIIILLLKWISSLPNTLDFRKIITEFKTTPKAFSICFVKAVSIVAISALIGFCLIALSLRIPTTFLEKNMAPSAYTLLNDDLNGPLSPNSTSLIDTFTDSIILLESADDTNDSLIRRAALIYMNSDGANNLDSLVLKYIVGSKVAEISSYPRYWHGFIITVKPLLSIMDLDGIRTLNYVLQISIIAFIVLLMWKQGCQGYIAPLIISYLMLMPQAIAKCLQYATCFYISFASIAFMLLQCNKEQHKRKCWITFLIIGILTAYFDFLTYPLATFGFPAVTYLITSKGTSSEDKIVSIIKFGFAWIFGYLTMWASKWIIASVITGENIILNAFQTISFRTSHSIETRHISLLEVEIANIRAFLFTPITKIMSVYILLYSYLFLRKASFGRKDYNQIVMPYLLIMAIPILWFAIATNHTYMHACFTNKVCAIAAFSIMSMLVNLCNTNKYLEPKDS